MGLYSRQVLPRITNRVLDNKEFAGIRARVTAGLSGTVLEIGFGSGLNLAHYPDPVERVLAVEPAVLSRKLAADRVRAAHAHVDYIGLDGQDLPLDSASVDHAVSTWTLCSIPDVGRALREIRRVLRAGGTIHFVEHGRSPDPAVAGRQDRFTPLQRRFVGGCHLNRQIDELISNSGLRIIALTNYYAEGPKFLGYMYEGVAEKN